MVALYDIKLQQLNVKTTFLHGELDEAIYMHQPKRFTIEGKERSCVQIEKIIVWFEAVSETMV